MTAYRRLLVCTGLLTLALAPGLAAAADNYEIDPIHSVIVFRIKHMDVGMFYGRFNSPTGKFTFDDQNPAASSFQGQVKAADFDSGNPTRDKHVKGPDFLNAKEFPTISFKSTSVKAAESGHYEIAGSLTLHGVSRPVTAALEKIGTSNDRIGSKRSSK